MDGIAEGDVEQKTMADMFHVNVFLCSSAMRASFGNICVDVLLLVCCLHSAVEKTQVGEDR